MGAGGVVDAVVFLRHRAGGGSSSTSSAPMSYPGSTFPAGGGGSFSDGGAGISADLGNFQVGLQGVLDNYSRQMRDTVDSLKQVPTKKPPAPKPTKPPKKKTPPHKPAPHPSHPEKPKRPGPHVPTPPRRPAPHHVAAASTAAALHTLSPTSTPRPGAIPVSAPVKVKKKR